MLLENSGIVSPVAQLASASTTAVSTLTPRDLAAAFMRRARSSETFNLKVTAKDYNAPNRPYSALVPPESASRFIVARANAALGRSSPRVTRARCSTVPFCAVSC